MKRSQGVRGIAAFTFGALSFADPCGAIVSSGATLDGGININARVGAETFYLAGYTGTRAIVANIEAGTVWNGHESLRHVQTTLVHPNAGTVIGGQLGQADFHATWVGAAIGGRSGGSTPGNHQRGIAYGATMWTGAIADSFVSGTTSFNVSNNAYIRNPYRRALLTGPGDDGAGPTADVVNNAWLTGSNTPGNDYYSVLIDALVKATGKIVVLPAGNSGPTSGISSPAAGHNGIVVGATASHSNQYDQVASFSGRGLISFYNPVAGRVAGTRARVDILAPGDDLKLALYGGSTGGHTGIPDPTGGAINHYTDFQHGTEFASAIVAGGAGLLVDYAKDKFGAKAKDTRVIKAVLLNSADKLAGWNNAQVPAGAGVITTQALDLVQGAGQMNLNRAFDQFRIGPGHTNGTGIGGSPGTGGQVHAIGWDDGLVTAASSTNGYFIQESLKAGTTLTVTLTWLANCAAGFGEGDTSFSQDSFANLDLEIWTVSNGVFTTMLGSSRSPFSNTEHLRLTLAADGLYAIKVKWNGFIYNRIGDAAQAEYGLAWYASGIPAPGSLPVFMLGVLGAARRRRAPATIPA